MRQSAENVSLVRVAEAQFPADFADLRADRADFFMLSVLPKFTILRNLRINLRNLREIKLRAYHPDISPTTTAAYNPHTQISAPPPICRRDAK